MIKALLRPQQLLKTFAFPVGVPVQLHQGLAILWVAMGLAVLAHAQWMPTWAILLNLAALVVHVLTMVQWPSRRQKIDNIAAIALFIILTQVHHNFPDRETGIAIFPILFIFKLRQLYKLRDYHVLCMMACIQTGLIFLYQQSILMLLYVCAICVLLIYAMAVPQLPDSDWNVRQRIRTVGKLCLQSVPFLLLLFVLFPRIPGPLWSLPSDDNQARTGITDRLEIGKISNLVQSDKVVFRANFTGDAPEQSRLYWRGPVLWNAGDSIWTPGIGQKRRIEVTQASEQINYSITMEEQQDKWLFALGLPYPAPAGTNVSSDLQLLSNSKKQGRQLYQIQSYLQYQIKELQPQFFSRGTRLPLGKNPQTVALARQWANDGYTPQQIIDNALGMFNESFSYTLQPPLMQENVVDQFLFTHKEGFCSHFATSFATIMRAAGIPARIIIGFQGGEYNDIGKFYLVRELDAHAWVEVWLPENGGWVQIDPTAAVAPLRIESGMSDFLTSEVGRTAGAPANISDALPFTFHKRLAAWVDAVRHNWNQNILQYDRKKQSELFSKLGLPELSKHPWLVLATLLALLAIITAILLFRRPKNADPVKTVYDSFCKKLQQHGMIWQQWQAPLHRQQLASQRWPKKAQEIGKITKTYLELRYANRGNLSHLKQLVRSFTIN